MIAFEYTRPTGQKAALDAIAKDASAQFIAGGTNLVDLMKKGVAAPQKLIDINNLPLKEIKESDGGYYIGALALNSDVAEHDLLKTKFPLLSQALYAGASAQLRNMALFDAIINNTDLIEIQYIHFILFHFHICKS